MEFSEISYVYSKTRKNPINTLCGPNTAFLYNVKGGSTYSNHCFSELGSINDTANST
jgi:hypothetical protein